VGNLSSTPFPFLKIQISLWKSFNCKPSHVLSSDEYWEVLSFWNVKLVGKDKTTQKSNKRSINRTIKEETKREGQRKAKRCTTHRNQEKGKELVPLVVGGNLTHDPFTVTCMQIMKSNSNGRSRTSITCQCNLPLYNKG